MTDEQPIDEQVQYRLEGGVAWITLNRPEVKNAISPDQRDRVIALLAEASELLAVRAVVIGGSGDSFCTGADLRATRTAPPRPEGAPDRALGDVARLIRDGAQRLVAAILDCEKPVIAALNGTAAGIGAHIALACDLVVAAEGARLIEVFVRRGLVPDGGGAYLLPRLVGVQKAKELLFLGDDISAAEAQRIGLVSKVVPADQLDATVLELATRLATGPTRALSLTKWLVNRSLESDRGGAFADEAWAQELNMGTADANEGVQSFIQRRPPEYHGW